MSQAKKKWGKAKQAKEKRDWSAILLAEVAAEIEKNVPRSKVITPSKLAERFKISVTLARKVLRQLEADGKIQRLAAHHALDVYGRIPGVDDAGAAEAEAAAAAEEAPKKGGKKQAQKKKGKKGEEVEDEEPAEA
jgi:small subunit ribosomal protein S25e